MLGNALKHFLLLTLSCLLLGAGMMYVCRHPRPVLPHQADRATADEAVKSEWQRPTYPWPDCVIHYESPQKFLPNGKPFDVQIEGTGDCGFDKVPKIDVSFGGCITVGQIEVHNANWITAHDVRVHEDEENIK